MPLYEYQCETCGNRFEVIQKFADKPLETCRECGGSVHKLLSAPAIQFKGTGWYITDYARKGKSEPATVSHSDSNGNGKGPASETSAEAKADAKADARAEAKKEQKGGGKPAATAESK
ncbi:MAG: zinc ribbon domain-containing protein [Acidobacteria bacterium]|nr:MAG: zinc ribbon domain-containing protein [Acidobacteriota bacterium]